MKKWDSFSKRLGSLLSLFLGIFPLLFSQAPPANIAPDGKAENVSLASAERFAVPVEAEKRAARTDFEVPSRIQQLLDNKAYPSLTSFEALTTNDEVMLIELYRKETELTNRWALTWALAAVGGDASAKEFQQTLIANYGQQNIGKREREVLHDTVQVLGLLASRSEQAFQFLETAASESYWGKNRTWRRADSRAEANENRVFMGWTVQALGASGSPEFLTMVSRMREETPDVSRSIASSITTGMFYHDMVEKGGASSLLQHRLTGQMQNKYRIWIKTEDGRKWREWSSNAMKIKYSATATK